MSASWTSDVGGRKHGRAVGDQDFNFNPPPRREAKKPFEPPPWEKAQFEELARRKEAERVAAEAISGAVAVQAPTAATTPGASQEAGGVPSDAAQATESPPAAQEGVAIEEDPRIAAMMIELKSEEPSFGRELWRVSIVAGAIVAAIGAVFMVWGVVAIVATRRAGVTGSIGGLILLVFGLMFFGVGAWIVFRTLRQRGVL